MKLTYVGTWLANVGDNRCKFAVASDRATINIALLVI